MVAIDVTGGFHKLVDQITATQGAPLEEVQQAQRAAELLRSLAARTSFTKAASEIAHDIRALRRLLRENRHAYAQAGGMSETEGDRLEGEAGTILRACGANIARLQELTQADCADGAAYRVGVALALSERLASTSASFDKLRALRRQQAEQEAASRRRRQPVPLERLQKITSTSTTPRGPQEQHVSSPRVLRTLSGKGGGTSPARRLHAALFQKKKDTAGSPHTRDVHSSPRLFKSSASRDETHSPRSLPGYQSPSELRHRLPHHHQQNDKSTDASPRDEKGPERAHPQQQQQQHQLELELSQLSTTVTQTETSVREVAALNQAFSSAVSHQTAQIERLFTEAVRATGHIERANVQLEKTARTNKGAHWTLIIFMVLATLGLIIMDWWHS